MLKPSISLSLKDPWTLHSRVEPSITERFVVPSKSFFRVWILIGSLISPPSCSISPAAPLPTCHTCSLVPYTRMMVRSRRSQPVGFLLELLCASRVFFRWDPSEASAHGHDLQEGRCTSGHDLLPFALRWSTFLVGAQVGLPTR